MKRLFNTKWRFLLLIPMVILIINAFYFRYLSNEMTEIMVSQKLVEVTDGINMIAAVALTENNPEDTIKIGASFLDKLHYMYCGAFEQTNDGLKLISSRTMDTGFDPLKYSQFAENVFANKHGNLTIGFTPDGQTYRELRMYFCWAPINASPQEQYLLVGGVSEESVVTKIPEMVTLGAMFNIFGTFLLNLCLVILLCRLRELR